jgi:hypothetical protein
MSEFYSRLLSPQGTSIQESSKPYLTFTERHMQALWLEQKYFKNLLTLDGQKVEVVSPGIWNQEAGPDFLKAHLLIEGKKIVGDVELHLYADGWQQHRHHQDERYNEVVFHLFMWARTQKDIYAQSGASILQASLEDFLTIPLARIVQLIDLDLYPYKKFVGSGKCAKNLFYQLQDQKVVELFEAAADWRLKRKRN